jgi:hypothetical protein
MKDGDAKTRLEHSLDAMGTENDGNNVNVKFGALAGTAAAQTDPTFDSKTNEYSSFTVTFDMAKNGNGDETGMAMNAAHEGTHVGDFEDPLGRSQNPATAMDLFQYEYRGYQTSLYAAQALGDPSRATFNGIALWNGSWAKVDQNITNLVKGIPGHPENPIHNPWPDRFPVRHPSPF